MLNRWGQMLLAVLIALLASTVVASVEAEWPGFRGPNRDGRSLDTGLRKQWPAGGPSLLWKAAVTGKGFSSVAVSAGTVFVAGDVSDTLTLLAFDLEGKPKWKAPAGPSWTSDPGGSRSTPTVDGDNVYLLSGTGVLGCYDAKSGAGQWSREMSEFGGKPGGWGYAESPLVFGDSVIVKPGGDKCIVALDKTNGREVWATQGYSTGPEYGSCLLFTHDNTPMIATGTKAGLVCVNARTGEVLWSNDFCADNTANCPTPAYSDGYVFWANGYGKGGICMKLEPGGKASPAWTTKDMDCHHGGYIIDKGYIYGDNGGGLSCLELKTGTLKWKAPAVGKGSLCWADDMLYLFSQDGGQAALATCSPDALEIKGKVKVEGQGPSWAHPVVVGGKLYLRYDTNLYGFDMKAGNS